MYYYLKKLGEVVRLTLLIFLVFIYSCSDPKIDMTSTESMKSSIAKVRESLPAEKREQFDDAIQLMTLRQIGYSLLFPGIIQKDAGFEEKMKDSLNGKTGEQIITDALEIREERERQQKEQALQEIKELEEKKQLSIKASEQLKNFKILRSRFYKRKRDYSIFDEPIIELSVENGTKSAISRAYFKGTIASPGRSVPWLQETFNHSISGGLEPGEKASWSLAPNAFSDWGSVDAPSDAILTVTVEKVDGADGKALFSIEDFGEREEKRLSELKEEYNVKDTVKEGNVSKPNQ